MHASIYVCKNGFCRKDRLNGRNIGSKANSNILNNGDFSDADNAMDPLRELRKGSRAVYAVFKKPASPVAGSPQNRAASSPQSLAISPQNVAAAGSPREPGIMSPLGAPQGTLIKRYIGPNSEEEEEEKREKLMALVMAGHHRLGGGGRALSDIVTCKMGGGDGGRGEGRRGRPGETSKETVSEPRLLVRLIASMCGLEKTVAVPTPSEFTQGRANIGGAGEELGGGGPREDVRGKSGLTEWKLLERVSARLTASNVGRVAENDKAGIRGEEMGEVGGGAGCTCVALLTLDGEGLREAQRKRDESRRAEIARLMEIARTQAAKMQAIRAEKAKKSKEMLGNVPAVANDAKQRRKLLIKASGGVMARNPFSAGGGPGGSPSRRGSVAAGNSSGGGDDGAMQRRGGRLRAVIQARMSQIRTLNPTPWSRRECHEFAHQTLNPKP
jgi:hypothetical protein